MTESPRPRPILASVICFYEAILVFYAVIGFAFVHAIRMVHTPRTTVHASPLRLILSWAGYALAIGITVTLWKMRREAFYLAAARFVLGLGVVLCSFVDPVHVAHVNRVGQHVNMQAVGAIAIMFLVISLSINAAIAFYVGDITRPVYGLRR